MSDLGRLNEAQAVFLNEGLARKIDAPNVQFDVLSRLPEG